MALQTEHPCEREETSDELIMNINQGLAALQALCHLANSILDVNTNIISSSFGSHISKDDEKQKGIDVFPNIAGAIESARVTLNLSLLSYNRISDNPIEVDVSFATDLITTLEKIYTEKPKKQKRYITPRNISGAEFK